MKPTATAASPTVTLTDSVIAGAASVWLPSASGITPLSSPIATPMPFTSVPTVQLSSVSALPSVALKSRSTVASPAASTPKSRPIAPPQLSVVASCVNVNSTSPDSTGPATGVSANAAPANIVAAKMVNTLRIIVSFLFYYVFIK